MRQVVLTPDREDGGYVVTVPSLPGCISEGDTIDEALVNIKDAMAGYIESLEVDGLPGPAETQPA